MIIPILNVTLHDFPESSLSERDSEVLAFLSEEEFHFFTFEGLKRRLSLHPETLSRILDRLEAEGIVKKSKEGYTVTEEIAKRLKQHKGNSNESKVMLLQTFLPSDLPVEELIANLRGRWFGLLRWLGLAENQEGATLKWVTEDGDIQVDAKVTLNTLTIEARFLHGYNQNLALRAAYQLMTHISKLSGHARAPMARHVGYYGDSGFYLMPT
jgi:DNA-binding MarR family transcriptional regulator